MAVPVLVPKLGPNMAGGVVTEWYFPDGASVGKGEPVFRLECDYVAIEVEAESPGVLRHQVSGGDICRPGSIAAVILAPGERMPDSAPDDFGDLSPLAGGRQRWSPPADDDVIDWTEPASSPSDAEAPGDSDFSREPISLRRWSEGVHEPPGGDTTFDRAAVPDLDEAAFIQSDRVSEPAQPERHVYLPEDRNVEPSSEAANAWLSGASAAPQTPESHEPAFTLEQEAPSAEVAFEPENPWAEEIYPGRQGEPADTSGPSAFAEQHQLPRQDAIQNDRPAALDPGSGPAEPVTEWWHPRPTEQQEPSRPEPPAEPGYRWEEIPGVPRPAEPAAAPQPTGFTAQPEPIRIEPAPLADNPWAETRSEPHPAEPAASSQQASSTEQAGPPSHEADLPDDPWAEMTRRPRIVEPAFELRRPGFAEQHRAVPTEPVFEQRPSEDAGEPAPPNAVWPGETTSALDPADSVPSSFTAPSAAPVETDHHMAPEQPAPPTFAPETPPAMPVSQERPTIWPGQVPASSVVVSEETASVPAPGNEAAPKPEEEEFARFVPAAPEQAAASIPAPVQPAQDRAHALFLRTSADVSEAAKMRAQLAREWRTAGLHPGDEDIVVRAVATALRESPVFAAHEDVVGLCTLGEQGTAVRVLHGAATRPFRDAVVALAEQEPRPEAGESCACTVTSLGDFSLDEGVPQLRPGQVLAITMGAVRHNASFNGDRIEHVPTMTLTLAYDAGVLHEGAAVRLLARIRDLIEAPYALLVA